MYEKAHSGGFDLAIAQGRERSNAHERLRKRKMFSSELPACLECSSGWSRDCGVHAKDVIEYLSYSTFNPATSSIGRRVLLATWFVKRLCLRAA